MNFVLSVNWKNSILLLIDTIVTHYIDPTLSKRQINIIQGTILGGSSIISPMNGRNSYLSMRHKDLSWLSYKASELTPIISKKPMLTEMTNRWHSICCPLFNEQKSLFYQDQNRYLTVENLEKCNLIDIAFAIWYGDAGDYNSNRIILNTHIWGEQNSLVIIDYFQLLDYKAELFTSRGNYRIRLDACSSCQFIEMIWPVLPYSFCKKYPLRINK